MKASASSQSYRICNEQSARSQRYNWVKLTHTQRMYILPLLIVSSTALGLGYCCLDVYRNRHRLSSQTKSTTDLTCCEIVPFPDGDDLQAAGQTVTHIGHAVEHCASDDVGKCVEAIAHTLFHH